MMGLENVMISYSVGSLMKIEIYYTLTGEAVVIDKKRCRSGKLFIKLK
jgi:hypothetical protein